MFLSEQYALKDNQVTIVSVGFEDLPQYESFLEGKIKIYRLIAKRKNKEHCSFTEMADYLIKARGFCNKLLKSEKFDICQVFFGIPSGPIAFRLKKKYGVPYVIRFGGGDIPGFQNRFKVLYKLMGIPLKVIWKNADSLVANSEGLKKFAMGFYDKCDIDIINNGVDADTFRPLEEKKKNGCVELLFVSRLIERKGLQFLIPHLRELEEKSGKKLHLTIVGDGPYREKLEQIADLYSVRNMISFEGQKDKNEIADYYHKGDVFVFPSMREGMPNVVLEAMASGLPIIMREDCEGSRELIDGNGILATDDFCEALESYLELSEEDQRAMGTKSREKAVREFSWDSISDRYLNLFNEVIKK